MAAFVEMAHCSNKFYTAQIHKQDENFNEYLEKITDDSQEVAGLVQYLKLDLDFSNLFT